MHRIETPNKTYNAVWLDVKFVDGVAVTDSDDVAAAAERMGYTVTTDKPAPKVEAKPKPVVKAKPVKGDE